MNPFYLNEKMTFHRLTVACLWLLRLACAGVFVTICFASAPRMQMLNIAKTIAVFALSYLPRILRLEKDGFVLLYSVFLLFAALLGSVFDWYGAFAYYDVFAHLLSGCVCVLAAQALLERWQVPFRASFFAFFAISLTVALACLWEMYEFIIFRVLNNTAFARYSIAEELGLLAIGGREQPAALAEGVYSANTVTSLLNGAFDTFCDISCAVTAGICSVPLVIIRKHKTKHAYSYAAKPTRNNT